MFPLSTPLTVRRELGSAAGGLPVLLWMLAAIGMLWADVSWSEQIDGMGGYHKLLMIPLLLAQFRRSGQAKWVLLGFLTSSVVLMIVSWGLALIPGLTWRGRQGVGLPVKDYILQSEIFAIVAFGLLGQAAELWRARKGSSRSFSGLLAMSFFANVAYVATGRTTLVAMAVLLLLFGLRRFGWKGALGVCLTGAVMAGAFWASSPYLRQRVLPAVEQIRTHGSGEISTIGLRLEYWKKSVAFIAEAPMLGQGTGTIPQLFRRGAAAHTAPYLRTVNPHNQVLAVAIELGLPGAIVLIAMWIAHVGLFRPAYADRLVRAHRRFREHRLVAVQLAPVRLQQRMALCPRCRCLGRCDIAGPTNAGVKSGSRTTKREQAKSGASRAQGWTMTTRKPMNQSSRQECCRVSHYRRSKITFNLERALGA